MHWVLSALHLLNVMRYSLLNRRKEDFQFQFHYILDCWWSICPPWRMLIVFLASPFLAQGWQAMYSFKSNFIHIHPWNFHFLSHHWMNQIFCISCCLTFNFLEVIDLYTLLSSVCLQFDVATFQLLNPGRGAVAEHGEGHVFWSLC